MINAVFEKRMLRSTLQNMTFERFVRISKEWLKQARYVWFVNGNMSEEDAITIVHKNQDIMNTKSVKKEELIDVRPVCLPEKKAYVFELPCEDVDNTNSCIMSIFQYDLANLKRSAILQTVFQYLEEPTFNQLRTNEQLGYITFSRNNQYRDVVGGWFLVQSTVGAPEFLAQRIDAFIEQMWTKVQEISEEELKTNIEAVVTLKKEKDLSLSKETGRLWSEISTHQYLFDRREREIEHLRSVTREDFISMYKDLFFGRAKRIDV